MKELEKVLRKEGAHDGRWPLSIVMATKRSEGA